MSLPSEKYSSSLPSKGPDGNEVERGGEREREEGGDGSNDFGSKSFPRRWSGSKKEEITTTTMSELSTDIP
jgi:hypothetical protein